MCGKKMIKMWLATQILTAVLTTLSFCESSAQSGQITQQSSNKLLFEVLSLHKELATDEKFLAQAKMLGVYLEVAQKLDETEKTEVYAKILNILYQIKNSTAQQASAPSVKQEGESKQKSSGKREGESKSVYEPGAALLEIFKANSMENIPDLPVIRTYWKQDLAYSGGFLLPERISEIGVNSPYVARFSFYCEAKQAGKYGFTIMHATHDMLSYKSNKCKVRIGGVDVVKLDESDDASQGVCNLEKGFHRVEFWLLSEAVPPAGYGNLAGFRVKILTPEAFDAVPVTKSMMLLKREEN